MIRRLLTGLVALVFAATSVADAQTYRPGFGFSRPGFQFLGGGGGGGATQTTWNAADNVNATISNGGLTAQMPDATIGGARGVTGRSTATDYTFEVTAVAISGNINIGVATAGASLTSGPNVSGSYAFRSDGNAFINGSISAGFTFATADKVRIQVKAGSVLAYKNGTLQQTYSIAAGQSPLYPLLISGGNSGNSGGFTFSTTFTVPSGSTVWN